MSLVPDHFNGLALCIANVRKFRPSSPWATSYWAPLTVDALFHGLMFRTGENRPGGGDNRNNQLHGLPGPICYPMRDSAK
jgi:hypothetical protein